MPMFTVSHNQLFVPLILFTVYRIFYPSDHLVKVIHLFSGVYVCASILTHSVFFHNVDGRLPQMGVLHYPRL
jgi:hypothetical protein